MILAIDMKNYSLDNVFFNEQQKNYINETNFIRFIYSSNLFSLQGICISMNFSFDISNQYKTFSKDNFSEHNGFMENKCKCIFSITENSHNIQFIRDLEYNLLKQVHSHHFHINKIPKYKLYEQFQVGEIKICKPLNKCPFDSIKKTENYELFSLQSNKINNHTIIIKISGIWSSNDYYGLTYKLLSPY
jgi:hypothetical protein